MQFFLKPATNYAGPVSIYFIVSSSSLWSYLSRIWSDSLASLRPAGISPLSLATPPFPPNPPTSPLSASLRSPTCCWPRSPTACRDSAATNFTAFINWGDNSTNSGIIHTNAGELEGSIWLSHLHECRRLSGLHHHPKLSRRGGHGGFNRQRAAQRQPDTGRHQQPRRLAGLGDGLSIAIRHQPRRHATGRPSPIFPRSIGYQQRCHQSAPIDQRPFFRLKK